MKKFVLKAYDLECVAIPAEDTACHYMNYEWTVIQYQHITRCISIISSVASYPNTFTTKLEHAILQRFNS
jgi:hypothetical protein